MHASWRGCLKWKKMRVMPLLRSFYWCKNSTPLSLLFNSYLCPFRIQKFGEFLLLISTLSLTLLDNDKYVNIRPFKDSNQGRTWCSRKAAPLWPKVHGFWSLILGNNLFSCRGGVVFINRSLDPAYAGASFVHWVCPFQTVKSPKHFPFFLGSLVTLQECKFPNLHKIFINLEVLTQESSFLMKSLLLAGISD